jgi:hypothetical protein
MSVLGEINDNRVEGEHLRAGVEEGGRGVGLMD